MFNFKNFLKWKQNFLRVLLSAMLLLSCRLSVELSVAFFFATQFFGSSFFGFLLSTVHFPLISSAFSTIFLRFLRLGLVLNFLRTCQIGFVLSISIFLSCRCKMYSLSDVNIVISDVFYGSKVMEYVEAGVPDSVSVFHPHAIYKSYLYFHCSGYVPLSALCNRFGVSKKIPYFRHNFVVGEFASAVWRFRFIGQSSYAVYSRVKYEPEHKRYHIASFFKLDVQK